MLSMSILKDGKLLGKTVVQAAEMIGGFPSMGIQARMGHDLGGG
jgi:hypothetical protein